MTKESSDEPTHDNGAGGDSGPGAAETQPDAAALAKLAGSAFMRVVSTVAKGSIDAATGIAHDFSAGEPMTEILDHRVEAIRSATWNALGLDEGTGGGRQDSENLKEIGDRLIEVSWDPKAQPKGSHPSFRLILQSITPDEARILRFLAVAGPQPSQDVRTKTPFNIGSERLAGGINMVAEMAGCTYVEQSQEYLDNLNRLGLVRFSEEPVTDFRRYSMLSAHPRSIEAMHMVKKFYFVFRSIYLSSFGQSFCENCFTLEGYNAGGWDDATYDDTIIGKRPRVYQHKGMN